MRMPAPQPRRRFTIRRKNTKRVLCATRPSTDRIRTHSFLPHEERRNTTMTNLKNGRNKNMNRMCKHVSRFLLSAISLGSLLVSFASAQQAEEQKGIDQGNYNIKQSIE